MTMEKAGKRAIVTPHFTNSPGKSIDRTFRVIFELRPELRGEKVAKCKPSRTYRNPLFTAREWKKKLESGEYASQTDLASKVGVSRARVNQMLRLLKLSLEIQESVIRMGDILPSRKITERKLRAVLSSLGGGPAPTASLLHVHFTDLAEMVAVDGQDDDLRDEPGAVEMGPEEELPVVEPLPAHDPEPEERAQKRQDVG